MYDAAGRRLLAVKTSVAAGGPSRSLSSDLAKAGADYYEAVFKDPSGEYHRVAWRKGETARIWLPDGDYSGLENAILLAGRYEGRTLLATGTLSQVDGQTADAAHPITASTASVAFTLTALACEAKNAPNSGFKITKPDGPAADDYRTANGNHHETAVNGRAVPYFKVPKNSAEVEAVLEITGAFSAGGVSPLKLRGTPSVTSAGYAAWGGGPSGVEALPGSGLPAGSGVALSGDSGQSLDNNGVKLMLKTADADGWCAVSVDVPLSAYVTDNGHEVWHLRGGINYYQLDYGAGSAGGSVLLAVGNPASSGVAVAGGGLWDLVLYRGASRTPVSAAGYTFASAWAWLLSNAQQGEEYVIALWGDEASDPLDMGALAAGGTGVSLTLESNVPLAGRRERTLSLQSPGALFTVPAGYTLTLQNGITLRGWDNNNSALVIVDQGTLNIHDGGRITRNNVTSTDAGSGVWLKPHPLGPGTVGTSTLNMTGGSIDHNIFTRTGDYNGAGILAHGNGSTITMTGGVITQNGDGGGGGALSGGGVHLHQFAKLIMSGGEISGNYASQGGGVYATGNPTSSLWGSGIFEMNGGRIVGNIVDGGRAAGGGICMKAGATVTINAGEISRNHARNGTWGGGGIARMVSGDSSFTATLTFGTGTIILQDNTNANITGPSADGYNLHWEHSQPGQCQELLDDQGGVLPAVHGTGGFVWQ